LIYVKEIIEKMNNETYNAKYNVKL
jgi:hypothetical protein